MWAPVCLALPLLLEQTDSSFPGDQTVCSPDRLLRAAEALEVTAEPAELS